MDIQTPLEEVVQDVSNSYSKDLCTTNNHPKLNLESQQEFGSKDRNILNITEIVSNPINVDANVVDVELEVEELQLILNESVDELLHFLVKIEEVSTEEIDELISFMFNDEDKTWATKACRDMKGRKLETIILRKKKWLARIWHQVVRDVDVSSVEYKVMSMELTEYVGSYLSIEEQTMDRSVGD
ncbi:hypothetical protein PVK06_004760 [Gossypium arboreum]|uniref:Uncharacterized protein n=1 Tax=Gossypium arboreum TaxID=29729 RepID=A0ABR0QU39_GOSAR|nr:hypothetical protein PVK06_004760 [Gossypium arboreum]